MRLDDVRDRTRELEEAMRLLGIRTEQLRMYCKEGRVKVALALAKGKQLHDKRETIRRREVDRETRAVVKAHNR